jgi:plasmid maintenance system killer protein
MGGHRDNPAGIKKNTPLKAGSYNIRVNQQWRYLLQVDGGGVRGCGVRRTDTHAILHRP